MSLILAGSISLDSTFNKLYDVCPDEIGGWVAKLVPRPLATAAL
jgi:hypothetical protein